MEVLDGIHRVDGVNANVYALIDGKDLTLIDSGLPRNGKKIMDYIQRIDHRPNDISCIILTHFHLDHVGSAPQLKKLTGAKIAVHEKEADYVSQEKKPPRLGNVFYRAVSSVIKAEPIQPDIILKDNERIGELKIIHTPGHTPGSICILVEEKKVLFVGDTLRSDGGRVIGPSEEFTVDKVKARESVAKILTFDFDVMLPGHGDPITQKASEAVRLFQNSRNH